MIILVSSFIVLQCRNMILIDYKNISSTLQRYSLKMENRSGDNGVKYFVIFQQWKQVPVSSMPVAWLAQPVAANTNVFFDWDQSLSFIWSQTGKLDTGTIVNIGENQPTQVNKDNVVTLLRTPQGAFEFSQLTTQTESILTINCNNSIPNNTLCVGIAMGSAGQVASQVVQAELSTKWNFSPPHIPNYYVGFSTSTIQTGQVINLSMLSQVEPFTFPTNTYSAVAVLEEDNTWQISFN